MGKFTNNILENEINNFLYSNILKANNLDSKDEKIILITFLFNAIQANTQNVIERDGKYQPQLSDFQSSATQNRNVKINSIHTASSLDFAFQMSNILFLFTNNFN